VYEITKYILGTMAGGAADCIFWGREVGRRCRLFELMNNEKMSVSGASKIFADILRHYRGYGLSVGTMVAGSDQTVSHLSA
jgi:20S proteasome subunit beta 5